MDFQCPVCNKIMPYDLKLILSHSDEHVIEQIKIKKPGWVEQDGLCKRCHEYFKSQFPDRKG
ncbi:MAG: hypothetical protein JW869_03905 [Candidatus Omnitrophica bacterium]|nr:hypothetical protein [Candidatus Omnitrophota bacterium]